DLIGDLARGEQLPGRVLAAVVVGGVDDQPLGQTRAAQALQRPLDAGGVVVRRAATAAQDHVAVGIAARVEDRWRAGVVDAGEGVRGRGSANGVDGDLDVAVGAVL